MFQYKTVENDVPGESVMVGFMQTNCQLISDN